MTAITCVLLLLLGITSAWADCLQWGHNPQGTRVCMVDDLVNRNPIFPETSRVIPAPGEPTITNTPQPKCEDGWTVVTALSMHPMCARELRKPK